MSYTPQGNLRRDPRTKAYNYVQVTPDEEFFVEEFEELPGVFGFQLSERPDPNNIIVTNMADPSIPYEITTSQNPVVGQVYIDYVQGYCIFNPAEYGEQFSVNYKGAGPIAHFRNLALLSTFAGKTSDDLDEGATNLYMTSAEKSKLAGLTTGADNTNDAINAASEDTIADGDFLGFRKTVGGLLRKISWANVKALLKTYFDTLYTTPAQVTPVKTYITKQTTNTRVTGSGPSSLGNYRSYLRAAGARTYSETNGSPTTGPSTSNGYLLYANRSFAAGDTNNEPSRYEIYIGTGKEPVFEFYKNTGRTGRIDASVFTVYGGAAYDGGNLYGYDPASGIAWVTKSYLQGGTVAAGMDEANTPITGNIYFDIKC